MFQIEQGYNLIGHSQKTVDRFWSKVIPPIIEDGCWNWSAGTDKNGYGYFTINGNTFRAHRFSYEYFYGQITTGLLVLHSCDNPSCVNPNHLSEGTILDNAKDRIERGRQVDLRGGRSGTAVYSDKDIVELLEGIISRKFQLRSDVLQYYDMTENVLANILNRRCWTNITDKYSDDEMYRIRKLVDSRRKLTDEQVFDVRQRASHETIISIAIFYGVGEKLIKSILVGKTYYDV